MNDIKIKILTISKSLFNQKGVAEVSLREISRETDISHSHLKYYFNNKNILLEQLHNQILSYAIQINQESLKINNELEGLYYTTLEGFKIIYEFRFFMIDFNWILRQNPGLHQKIREVEILRFEMYNKKINRLMEAGYIYIPDTNYLNLLIDQIKIFSDYWVSSSEIYDQDNEKTKIVKKYSEIFLNIFYPFLTDSGKMEYKRLAEKYFR